VLADAVHLPGGPRRERERDLGLQAVASPSGEGVWSLHVETTRFAQYVAVDCPGFRADRSWFHLVPGHSCDIGLVQVGTREVPRGAVRALNAVHDARITTSS
jgi:beta-mannosidase